MSSRFALILLGSIAWAGDARFEAVEPHMGTLVRIQLYAPDEQAARRAFRAAFDRIAALDRALSDYRDDSELNLFCRAAPGHAAEISEDLYRVLAAAQQLAMESGGAFDVTQGPVIRLWRQARRNRTLPDARALSEAQSRSGFRKLHLNDADRTATLDLANMQLDLGGIAKGYAADEALAVLGRMGITSAMVEASGDLAFSHAPPGERGWKIGLGTPERMLELTDGAVSTSGDTEQYFELNGKRYSHIIDPATGQALTDGAMVSVIARRGIIADSLATALCVLGEERGAAVLEKYRGATATWLNHARGR